MDGQPVWLVSVSKRNKGHIDATGRWGRREFDHAEKLASDTLAGVGDPGRQRAFRMNITFCIHRAVSDTEIGELPRQWRLAPGSLAGGPVEVLWSRGIEHRPASQACHKPGHRMIIAGRPDLWVPDDCGACPPCLARAAIERKIIEPLRPRR